jgi:hypothetical protein
MGNSAGEGGGSRQDKMDKLDKLIDSTVSYKDVPVMKDLLHLQKKIRKTLEEWLSYCRNSLGILEPEMYIMPDLPIRPKGTRFDMNHSDFDKIAFYRRKSRSAENLTVKNDLFDNNSSSFLQSKNGKFESRKAQLSAEKKRPGKMMRSKSAFISKSDSIFGLRFILSPLIIKVLK